MGSPFTSALLDFYASLSVPDVHSRILYTPDCPLPWILQNSFMIVVLGRLFFECCAAVTVRYGLCGRVADMAAID